MTCLKRDYDRVRFTLPWFGFEKEISGYRLGYFFLENAKK